MQYVLITHLFDGFEGYFTSELLVECDEDKIKEACSKLEEYFMSKEGRPYLDGEIEIQTVDKYLSSIKADDDLLEIMGVS